ncbi:MAG: serine/threonine protein kinase [Clostridia bacterium]|nr:serine/threonine protein kinase [Clostridia bacterium]
MTREEYITELLKAYAFVSVLSDNGDGKTLKFKNKISGTPLVVRSFSKACPAYEDLYAIHCENLPLVYDVIEADDGQIVLEEFIDGVTVAQVMESGKYRYSGTRKVLRSVCHALTVLHERQIVHRDIKPENVMIADNGRVVLIDLHIARKITPNNKDTVVMGTVGYASPEQLGVAQSDARTDIYAVGVLLNVMMTGKHPSEKLARGRAGRIVRTCTNIHPNDRYASAQKLAQAL